tara:strand:+ start:702 stop:989 length:288 start_codon:yes stop_codon:yes gene_type:complete
MSNNILFELNIKRRNTQTLRGIKKDNIFKSKKTLNPNNPSDLKKIKSIKKVFQLYDVIGIDDGKKKVKPGAGRKKLRRSSRLKKKKINKNKKNNK